MKLYCKKFLSTSVLVVSAFQSHSLLAGGAQPPTNGIASAVYCAARMTEAQMSGLSFVANLFRNSFNVRTDLAKEVVIVLRPEGGVDLHLKFSNQRRELYSGNYGHMSIEKTDAIEMVSGESKKLQVLTDQLHFTAEQAPHPVISISVPRERSLLVQNSYSDSPVYTKMRYAPTGSNPSIQPASLFALCQLLEDVE